jgi:hypothetical protein
MHQMRQKDSLRDHNRPLTEFLDIGLRVASPGSRRSPDRQAQLAFPRVTADKVHYVKYKRKMTRKMG